MVRTRGAKKSLPAAASRGPPHGAGTSQTPMAAVRGGRGTPIIGRRRGMPFRIPNFGFGGFGRNYNEEDSDNDGSDGEETSETGDVDDVIDIENEQFIGSMRGEIVGLRYYHGEISRGELVQLVREPANRYDPNAVRVDNSLGDQIGHIKREIAAALCAVLDKKLARVEGRAPTNKNTFSMPVDLLFYGRVENSQQVKDAMAKHGYKLSDNEVGKGHCSYSSQFEGDKASANEKALAEFSYTSVMKAVNSEELNKELDKMFETLREEDKLLHAEPAKMISANLFLHQKQALAWLIKRENGDDFPPFWIATQTSANRTVYKNTLTGLVTDRRPETMRGGMLADDMGLGKTLEIIALIATNGPKGQPMKLRRNATGKRSSTKSQYDYSSRKRKLANSCPRTPAETGSPRPMSSTCERVLKKLREARERSNSGSKPDAPATKSTKSDVSAGFENRNSLRHSDDQSGASYVNLNSDSDDSLDFTGRTTAVKKKRVTESAKRAKVVRARIDSDDSDYEFFNKAGPAPPSKTKEAAATISDEEDEVEADDDVPPIDDPELLESPIKPEEQTFEFESLEDVTNEPRATLIVCPMSVMQNWEDQLEQHFDPAAVPYLNIHRQYGNKLLTASELKKMDVVITTYQTMASSWKRNKDPLFEVEWLRVVLDEAHIIRNPRAQMTKAACDLKARRRWVLTGTPIQNRLLDLWSIVKFLRIKPLDQRVFWRQCIERPISKGSDFGFRCIRALMIATAMRRTKTQEIEPGKPLVALPSRTMLQETMEFSEDERMLYNIMLAEGRLAINRYIEEGTFLHHYGQVLAILMRLRQLCCHPYLVRKAAQKAKELGLVAPDDGICAAGNEDRNHELAQTLLQLITSGDAQGCPICFENPPVRAVMNSNCKHYYCRECITEWLQTRQDAKCPMCRGILEPNRFIEEPSKDCSNEPNKSEGSGNEDWQSSVKVDAVMTHLLRLRQEDPTIKSIVVSQFTSFLDVIEKPLMNENFDFTRLDGTMSAAERSDAVRSFQSKEPDAPTVFLLSLKAGGVGINLTAATRVFLMDPAWNPACEEQCFDRCHRLGQNKEVTIIKFIVGNTIEERMLELQEKKRLLMTEAFGGGKKRDQKDLINQVRALLS